MQEDELGEPLLTSEEARPRPDSLAIFHVCLAALGAVCFGYALGFSSPALPAMQGSIFHDLRCGDDDDSASVTSTMASLWSSIINVGAMAGALCGGKLFDAVGRRGALKYAAAPLLVVGWAATALSRTAVEIVLARIVVGAGVGLCSSAVPVYISETAPVALRGALGSVNQLAVTVGIWGVYLVGYLLPHSRRDYSCGQHAKSIAPAGWVALAWIGASLGGALFAATLFIPETPTWLTKRPLAKDSAPRQVVDMLLPERWASKDVDAAARAPLRLAMTLMLVQQCSGINAVIFYAGDILGSAGMADRDLGGLIVMAIQVAMTGLGCPLVDRLGRRPLLLGSLAGMIAAASLLGTYFFLGDAAPPTIALVALVIYISSFSLGLGPLPWALMAELLPDRTRGPASAVATTINWLCSFLVTESFAAATTAFSPASTFFFFAAVCLAGFAFVSAALPETKGKTLAEIEAHFSATTGPRRDRGA